MEEDLDPVTPTPAPTPTPPAPPAPAPVPTPPAPPAPAAAVVMLPEDGKTYGAWLPDAKKDGSLGVYVSQAQGVVIGWFKSQKDKVDECDLALSVGKDGTVTFQYHDRKGNVQMADVKPQRLYSLLLGLLREENERHGHRR